MFKKLSCFISSYSVIVLLALTKLKQLLEECGICSLVDLWTSLESGLNSCDFVKGFVSDL